MANIATEIKNFLTAIYGKDVRASLVSLAEKLNHEVENNTVAANNAADSANEAAGNANAATERANTAAEGAEEAIGNANTAASNANAAAEQAKNVSVVKLEDEVAGLKSDLTKYLPLTGGQLSGNTTIVSGTMPQFALKAGTSKFVMLKNANADGSVEDGTHLKDYPNNNDGTTFAGIILKASNDLKYNVSLHKSVSGNASAYNIFGEHNKPSGSYNGNGSSTSRTITIGGIGKYLIMRNTKFIGIVHSLGMDYQTTSGTSGRISSSEIKYVENGDLIISSTNTYVNANGESYFWSVV